MKPEDLLKHYKTQTAIARSLGAAQSSVAEWFAKGYVPEGRQYQAELATGGALRADKPALRQDAA